MSAAEPPDPEQFDAVIVGGGPRGVATVLRAAARTAAAGGGPVRMALLDAVAVGPGATWLIDQPAQYLNNTQADATTVHPDDSTPMSGPAAPGPGPRGLGAAGPRRTAGIRRGSGCSRRPPR